MNSWLVKFFAGLKHSPRTMRTTGCAAALHAAVLPLRGATTATGNTGKLLPAGGRCTVPGTIVQAKPLRIIEWVESASANHPSSRRMVMSGRLADICAELDRLAAMESA